MPLKIVLFCTLILVASCLRVDQLPDIELEDTSSFLAFPLVMIHVQSDELIAELQKETDIRLIDEQLFAAYFRSDPFIQSKQDLFPKTTFGFPIPILDSVVSIPVPVLGEIALNKGILKGDQLIFVFNSAEMTDVSLQVTIPQLSKDGIPFMVDYTIPFDGNPPSSITTPPQDLSGFTVDFSGDVLTLEYDARTTDGTRVLLPLSFAQITAFDFSYLEGSISSSTIPTGLQRIDIDIQDTLIDGEYRFENPKIHFDIANSFGIPIGIKVKEVYIIGNDLEPHPLISELFDEIIDLQFPGFNQMGQVITDRISFDKTNSNIAELAQDNIVAIDYNLDIIINPENEEESQFFVLDTSKAVITAEVELSFDARISNIQIEKTVAIDLEALDSLTYLRLKLVAENGIPLSFSPTLILQDTLTQSAISLSETNGVIIESALVDDVGNQISPSENVLFYSVGEEQIKEAAAMNQLKLILTIQSPLEGEVPAKIKSGQGIEVRIGAEVILN